MVRARHGPHNQAIGADIFDGPTTQILADVRNNQQVFEIKKGIDAIIHTAALHGRDMDLNYPREDFVNTNISGTLNLLNACVANRFLIAAML